MKNSFFKGSGSIAKFWNTSKKDFYKIKLTLPFFPFPFDSSHARLFSSFLVSQGARKVFKKLEPGTSTFGTASNINFVYCSTSSVLSEIWNTSVLNQFFCYLHLRHTFTLSFTTIIFGIFIKFLKSKKKEGISAKGQHHPSQKCSRSLSNPIQQIHRIKHMTIFYNLLHRTH